MMNNKVMIALGLALFCLVATLVSESHTLHLVLTLMSVALIAYAFWASMIHSSAPLSSKEKAPQAAMAKPAAASHFEGLRQVETYLNEHRHHLVDQDIQADHHYGQYQRLQQSFRELEERYNFMLGRSNDGSWEWNLQTGAIQLSPSWKVMLGYGEQDHIETASAFKALIHKDDYPQVEQRIQALIMGEIQHFQDEHRLICKDGSLRWVVSRCIALRHASGKPYKVIGHCTNINAVKRIEEILTFVAEGTIGLTGKAFFQSLVKHFAMALGVRRAFITECLNKPPTRVRALAFWENGEFIEVEYDLAPTPCNRVINEGKACFIPDRLGEDFPSQLAGGYVSYLGIPIFDSQQQVLGHLCFEDKKMMDEDMLINSVYRIFVTKAGEEMERMYKAGAMETAES